jgi:hypothetical protein
MFYVLVPAGKAEYQAHPRYVVAANEVSLHMSQAQV